jgi:hypothetical protein
LNDTAVLSGGYSPTGTITFTLYLGSTLVDTETIAVSGNGSYTTPTGYTLPTTGTVTGTYQWDASYSGDTNNNSVSDNNAANEQILVSPASPSISTTPNLTTVTLGTSSVTLKDTAVLSGGYSPTGTITFTLYLGSTLVDTESVAVSGNGSYTTPTGYTLPTTGTVIGTYQWDASYSGDTNNSSASDNNDAKEQIVVSPASPSITTTPNLTTVTLGTSSVTLKDRAVLSGGYSPTGTITFTLYLGSTLVDTETVAVSGNGSYTTPTGYTLPTTGTVIGTYQWDASYSGDTNNSSASDNNDAKEQIVVSPASPSINTTPSMTSGATSGGVIAGEFATIGFWHNKNGQLVINSFNGSSSATALGNWLATTFPHLFGASNPYISATLATFPGSPTSLAGLTNAQIATVYANLWTPSGVTKNTYVQAFAVALGLYADTTSLGGASLISSGLAAKYGFVVTASGAGTFNVGNDGAAFGVANGTSLPVTQILQIVDSNFTPATGLFYGGNTSKTSQANDVLNGINSVGDIPGGTSSLLMSGGMLMDSATLSGGYNPGGTITFYLFAPGVTPNSNDSNNVYADTVTVAGNGNYDTTQGTNPGGYLPTVSGTYEWVAVYSGDKNNNGVVSPFGSEPFTVGAASPTLNTIPGGTVVIGSGAALTDSATLAAGVNPTGTITFYLFAPGVTPNATDSNNVYADTVTVSGNGVYTTASGNNPGGYVPTVTGTYQWLAVYSGDSNNAAISGTFGDEPETVSGHGVLKGDFATIGFWHNKNGQALIDSLNGSSGATSLSQWLATNFPNLYGGGAGATSLVNHDSHGNITSYFTNAQIASAFLSSAFFGASGQKTNAQILAAALAVYATSTNLAGGTMAGGYGFNISLGGVGSDTYNVGSNGSAFGVPNNTTLTVLQLLIDTSNQAGPGGSLNSNLFNAANVVFSDINQTGDIAMLLTGSTQSPGPQGPLALGPQATIKPTWVAIDGLDPANGAAEQAAIDAAIKTLDTQLGSFGVDLVDVTGNAAEASQAPIAMHLAPISALGGAAQGVLGCTLTGGDTTIITGWNWYFGSDPSTIGKNQLDFQTVATHELGHALGLGEGTDPTSVMYPYLSYGETLRTLSASDLSQIAAAASVTPPITNPTPVTNPTPTNPADSVNWSALTPNQAYIDHVWIDVFGVPADASSMATLSAQLAGGISIGQFASDLVHSAPYYASVITPIYEHYLGRAPDTSGLNYWIGQMQNGLTDEQLEAGFIGSAEYYQHAGGTDVGWVDALYSDLLGRAPDTAGQGYWVAQLAAGAQRGAVAYGFAASLERESTRVQDDYFHYLGRAADQGGLNAWVNAFAHGSTNEDLIAGFLSSSEFYRNNS